MDGWRRCTPSWRASFRERARRSRRSVTARVCASAQHRPGFDLSDISRKTRRPLTQAISGVALENHYDRLRGLL